MMSANRAGRFAVDLAGFPINLSLYSKVIGQRSKSFRMIAPSGQPAKQQYVDPGNKDVVITRDECGKGVENGDGFVLLTPEAQAAIEAGVKTELAELRQLVPCGTVPWDLAINRFAVLPDDKVPGSEQSANILWNGLREKGLAYITQVSLAGKHDSILAIYADDAGLHAAALPFAVELYDVPGHTFTPDDAQADMFGQFVEANYEESMGDFAHASFVSEYRTRRDAAIESVLAGKKVTVKAPVAKSATPDLMAALQAGVKKPAAKGKAKKPTPKKVAA
jgi:non-homologous end joining protein Ku